MYRNHGLRAHAKTPQAKAIRYLDEDLSKLVRQHYEPMGCFTCGAVKPWKEMDCGHFRWREKKHTRFDLRNLSIQCKSCNRFQGGRTYELGKKLDEIWGSGTADLMERLSNQIKLWDIKELEQLRSAAKMGRLPYRQLYDELTRASPISQVAS